MTGSILIALVVVGVVGFIFGTSLGFFLGLFYLVRNLDKMQKTLTKADD